MAGNSDLVADKVTALRLAERMGCRGAHQHPDGKWMPCETMEEYEKLKDNKPTSEKTGLDIIEQNRRYRSRKGKKKRGWEPLGERGLTSIDTMPDGGLTGGRSGTIKALWAPRAGDTDVFDNPRQARRRSRELGCIGISRRRSYSGQTVWMPCSNMTDYQKRTGSTAFGRNWQRQRQRRQMEDAVEREVRRQLRRKESLTEMLYSEKALGQKLRRARIATTAVYNPDAVDADADALVQEGTPFERPAMPARVARRAQRMAARMFARQTRQRTSRDPKHPERPISDAEIDRHYAEWLELNPGYIDEATPHIQGMLSPEAFESAAGLRSRRSSPDGKPSKIEQAKKKILDRVKPEHRNKAERTIHWVFGSPGTGKTHLVRNGRVEAPGRDEAAHINPDDLKPHLPGYDGPNGDSTTHPESVHEAAQLMDSAAEEGMDMVVQGTGKNNPLISKHVQDESTYGDKVVRTRKKHVKSVAHLMYGGRADTTNDRIDRRNADPHSKQRNRPFGSDRELLEERMRFPDQIERGWYDEVYIYDNSANVDNPPLIAYRTSDGNFEILNRQKFNDFFGDQRHPLDEHGRTGAQRVEEAWIAQRDGTDVLSGERGRGWRPDQHYDTPIPGDGRTYREILDGLGYEKETQKRPKPLQGPPTPRGLGHDARRGLDLEEEEEGMDDLDIPYYDTLPDPDLPDEEMQTAWANDLEKRVVTNREQRRQRRAEQRMHQDGLKSRTDHHRMMPVEERNEVSIDALENPSSSTRVPGTFGLGGLSLEERLAWHAEHGTPSQNVSPDKHSGIGHLTDTDSQGRTGIDRLKTYLQEKLASNKEDRRLGRGTDYQLVDDAHTEALLEWLEDKTAEELHAAILQWGRDLYDDPDTLLVVNDSMGEIELLLSGGTYKTTHTGGLNVSSDEAPRRAVETLAGYPNGTYDVDPTLRPASGYLIPGAMIRRRRKELLDELGIDETDPRAAEINPLNDADFIRQAEGGAGAYGSNLIVLEPKVKERTVSGPGDLIHQRQSLTRIDGTATDDEIVNALIGGNGGSHHSKENSLGMVLERIMLGLDASSTKYEDSPVGQRWKEEDGMQGAVGTWSYHESLIHGSFTLGDVKEIILDSHQQKGAGSQYSKTHPPLPDNAVADGIVHEMIREDLSVRSQGRNGPRLHGISEEDAEFLLKELADNPDDVIEAMRYDKDDPDAPKKLWSELQAYLEVQLAREGSAQRQDDVGSGRQAKRVRDSNQYGARGTSSTFRFRVAERREDWRGHARELFQPGVDYDDPLTYGPEYEGKTAIEALRAEKGKAYEALIARIRSKKGGLSSKRESQVTKRAKARQRVEERESTISMIGESLEAVGMPALTEDEQKLIRNASSVILATSGEPDVAIGDEEEVNRLSVEVISSHDLMLTQKYGMNLAADEEAVMVAIPFSMRGAVKRDGVKRVVSELTADERSVIEKAGIPVDSLVDHIHDHWTRVAGGDDVGALLTQLSMAKALGWDDEKIQREIFHAVDRVEWDVEAQEFLPRDINYADLKKRAAAVVKKLGPMDQTSDRRDMEHRRNMIRRTATAPHPGAAMIVETLAMEHYYGEAYQAVLAAEQRTTAKRLKAMGVEKVTLYRGVIFSGSEAEHLDELVDQPPRSLEAGRPGAPLTSWSVSEATARGFADSHVGANEPDLTGYVIKSEVSVDDIVGLSTHGFGCLPEGECIVRHGEQTIQVLERYSG